MPQSRRKPQPQKPTALVISFIGRYVHLMYSLLGFHPGQSVLQASGPSLYTGEVLRQGILLSSARS